MSTSTLTLTASSAAVAGTANVTITGTSGSLTNTTSVALTISPSASFTLSASLTQAIKEQGRRKDATLFMVLLAAFESLLSRYSGQQDICVGTVIANRTRSELERLIGFFANTLVIRQQVTTAPPFEELIEQVKQALLDDYTHQDGKVSINLTSIRILQ